MKSLVTGTEMLQQALQVCMPPSALCCAGKPVIFAGTEEPAAFGELFSIGAIGGDKNKQVKYRGLQEYWHALDIWQSNTRDKGHAE